MFLSSPKKTLKEFKKKYLKRHKKLSGNDQQVFEEKIRALQKAIKNKNKEESKKLAKDLKDFGEPLLKKNLYQQTVEFVLAVAFALIFATIFRQMYLEPMEIPTGSMRPTFREKDRLIVSKMPYGINIPLTPGHLLFEPSLVNRGDIIVFTVENMDLDDAKTKYFGIFPGYKRLVKRCLAKPGDTIYFYGGKIYGIDVDGNTFVEWLDPSTLAAIDHVPFIRFEGRTDQENGHLILKQMNMPLARINLQNLKGEIQVDHQWIEDQPTLAQKPHDRIVTYSDFWGFGNFAPVRLVKEAPLQSRNNSAIGYLELHHHPTLNHPRIYQTGSTQLFLLLNSDTSYLPVLPEHIEALKKGLYTSRFVVKDGIAHFYSYLGQRDSKYSPKVWNIPDGTYEFYNGIAYQLGFEGILKELPKDHPIYPKTFEQLQTLVNYGVEFNTLFGPNQQGLGPYPNRFAYFNQGALFVMGTPIYGSQDPILIDFVKNETDKENKSSYIAFVDRHEMIKDDIIDKNFLKTYGLKIPEKMYLGLGDNYSVSGDSREFGLIPEANLEGSPWLLLWPSGSRWGLPNQRFFPIFTLPKALLCLFALAVTALWMVWKAKREKRFRS